MRLYYDQIQEESVMARLKEIQAQIEQLQREAAEQRDRELVEAVQKIRDLMQEYGITVDDLQTVRKKGAVKNAAAKKSGTAQFRDVETGNTWSGRGRMPNWLSGQDKERFRI
jgi:DNA-binding protein H-NS